MIRFLLLQLLVLVHSIASSTLPEFGANVTVDGIKSRPEYNFAIPQEFFVVLDDDSAISGKNVYRAEDFGAVADPTIDSRAAIQDAVDAAHEAGGGLVLLQSGTFGIVKRPDYYGGVHIRDNVFIKGMGMGKTVLRVMDGWDFDLDDGKKLTGIIRSPAGGVSTKNFGIADLTLDGNRENTNGLIDGFYNGGIPLGKIYDEDIWVVRVEACNCSGFGFEQNERTDRLTISNSVSHHNGRDGFTAVYVVDSVYQNNIAYENDRHGFNIVRSSNDLLLLDNLSRDNGGAGVVIQRGGYDRPLPTNLLITGGTTTRNGDEGVLLLMSYNIEVNGVDVLENGSYGVRIHGSSHASVLNNQIIDNSRSQDGFFSAIQLIDYHDFKVTNRTYLAENNIISGNVIQWTAGRSGKTDVENLSMAGSSAVKKETIVPTNVSTTDFIIGGVSVAAVLVALIILGVWWKNEKKAS